MKDEQRQGFFQTLAEMQFKTEQVQSQARLLASWANSLVLSGSMLAQTYATRQEREILTRQYNEMVSTFNLLVRAMSCEARLIQMPHAPEEIETP